MCVCVCVCVRVCVCVCLDSLPSAHLLCIKHAASGMRPPSAALRLMASQILALSVTVQFRGFFLTYRRSDWRVLSLLWSPDLIGLQDEWLHEGNGKEIQSTRKQKCRKMFQSSVRFSFFDFSLKLQITVFYDAAILAIQAFHVPPAEFPSLTADVSGIFQFGLKSP